MRVVDILSVETIVPHLRSRTKVDALRELSEALVRHHPDVPADRLLDVLLDREKLGTTAIGEGIAIPHGKLHGLTKVIAAFGRIPEGVDFESLDGAPTKLVFMLVAPEDSAGVHLKALARISRLLKDRGFRERLLEAEAREQLYQIIREEDERL